MTDWSSRWAVAGASALGARHVRSGAPNQDAYRWETLGSGADQVAILAVGDGHGGSRYVRSDVGSRLAVEVACRIAASMVTAGLLDAGSRRIERRVRDEMARDIVATWRAECFAHLASAPFTTEEEVRAGAALSADPLLSYGSTLLVAILGQAQSVLLQLGDGDSLIGTPDGRVVSPLPEDGRLTGSETTSLCLPDATSDFRCAVVGELDPVLVLLATDGYGVAFADGDWRRSVVADLIERYRTHGPSHVEGMLPGWLEESARVGGDDATAIVAYRGEPRRPATTRRRVVPLVVAVAAGVLVGVAAGWLAASTWLPGGGGTASATTTLPVEPTSPVDSTAPEPEPTTTSTTMVPPTTGLAPEPTDVPAVEPPAGGAVAGEGTTAWIVGASGEVVTFRSSGDPDPVLLTDPDPGLVPGVGPRLAAVAGDRWWWLEDGALASDGVVVGIGAGEPLQLASVDVEGGLVWALTVDATHLLSIDPGQWPTGCQVFEVGREGVEGLPAEVAGDEIECTRATEDGDSS